MEVNSSQKIPYTATHFWISSYPFFETTLFFSPLFTTEPDIQLRYPVILKIFDADGALVNEATLELSSCEVSVLELDQFSGGCKLESGIKYAHLVVEAPVSLRPLCRMHTREGAAMLGAPLVISGAKSVFFPFSLAKDRQALLTFINIGSQQASVKGRVYFKKRTPEMMWTIPANGARAINIQAQFEDFIDLTDEEQVQGYLRVGTRAEAQVGVQLLERIQGTKDTGIFLAMS